MDRTSSRRRNRQIAVAGTVIAIVALVLLWDWNWFKPLVERQASTQLGREVRLGHFDIEVSRHPRVVMDRIEIANPPGFPADRTFAKVERLTVGIDPWVWFDNTLRFTEIDVVAPDVDVAPGPNGERSYLFPALQDSEPKKEPGRNVEILKLRISDGVAHIVEPKFKTDFQLRLRTEEPAGGAEANLRVDAEGTYAGAPINGRFIGGSVLSLRDAARPYPVDLEARNGETQVQLKGTIERPLQFGGARLKLDFSGANLADLYALTGVPLPPTPPYQIAGDLDYAAGSVLFRKFTGSVGGSDLSGDVAVDLKPERRRVTMTLASNKVDLKDLAGFIGAPTTDDKTQAESAEQKAARVKQQASGKLLPDVPISLPRLRAADLDVRYKAARIESESTPLDDLDVHLLIEDGVLSLAPLRFGVGDGRIALNLKLDGRENLVKAVADVDFHKLDLSRILKKMTAFNGAGTIGGSARIDSRGNSLADMLGNGDGDLKLFMSGGDISALMVNLVGLDFGNSLLSAIGIPRRTDLRCMVSDFALDKGQLNTRVLLVDTTEANVIGSGWVNLREEQVDYQLRTEPKHINLASVAAPILIKGPLKDPRILPRVSSLAARGGAALLLGTLFTPLAALIPTVQLGMGEDNDCVALLKNIGAPQAKK